MIDGDLLIELILEEKIHSTSVSSLPPQFSFSPF